MASTLFHAAAAAAALAGCGFWWRRATDDRVVRAIIGAGLLLRLVAGAALFWISFARLPIGTSLQLEPGFWFFALDAETYYRLAADAAARGWTAIATINAFTPSMFYVKTLAAAIRVFGPTPATSILLNLVAYVALSAAILRWHRRVGTGRGPLLVSVAAVSLMPSWILWSFQPLKDTVFLALVGVLFSALDAWYARLAAARWNWTRAGALVVSQMALAYAAAGIRWYFPLLISALAPAALVALVLSARRPAVWRLAVGVVAIVALAEMVLPAAGPYLPKWITPILHPTPSHLVETVVNAPSRAGSYLERSHAANVRVQGSTEVHLIHEGSGDEGGALLPDVSRPTAGHQAAIAHDPLPARLRGMLAVMLLPRALALPVGHVSVGGGRGLWLFVDLDTICFEIAVVAALLVIGRQIAAGAGFRPVFWQLLLATGLIAILLAAEGSNFGTLFRMRSMVALGVALLPLGVGRRPAPASAG